MCFTRLHWIAAWMLASLAMAAMPRFAPAQSYPSKPIRFVVPFAPGGGSDTHARIVAQKMTELFGQPVVVDNRAGAGTLIGTEVAAKAAPDGYTIFIVTIAHPVNAAIHAKLPFDPVKDFAPISWMTSGPLVLAVHPSLTAGSVKELVAMAKAKPGQLHYSSGGIGTSNHLAGELFKSMARIDITHIPYKGGAPGMTAVLSNEVAMTFGNILATPPLMKSGRLRGLAVTGLKRSPALPELPTMDEAGVAGYEVGNWYGLVTRAGTPQAAISRLHDAVIKILKMPDVNEKLSTQGLEIVGSTPKELGDHIVREIKKWGGIVRAAGIKPE